MSERRTLARSRPEAAASAAVTTGGTQAAPDRRKSWIQQLLTIAAVYAVMNLFIYYSKSKSGDSGPEQPDITIAEAIAADRQYDVDNPPNPETLRALWTGSEPFKLRIDISDTYDYPSSSGLSIPGVFDVELNGANFSKGFSLKENVNFNLPQSITQDNGTLYLHAFMARQGNEPIHRRIPITSHLPKKKIVKTKLLLGSEESPEEEEDPNDPDNLPYLMRPLVPNIYPNVSVGVIYDLGNGIPAAMPEVIANNIVPSFDRDSTGKVAFIYPILFNNEFWQLNSKLVELNATMVNEPFTLNLNLYSTSFFWFQMLTNMDHSFKEQAKQQGGRTSEVEQIKVTLLDTNPYLLGITVIVSVFHMLFEFLAFKSDISHWKNKKDTVGVSVRSIVANVVMQTIIFLYLVDNNDDTSYMILLTQGAGIMVEAWKINKVAIITVGSPPPPAKNRQTADIFNLGLVFVQDRNELSEVEERTKEYDSIAFKYLYIAAVPLIGAYAVYSVMYVPHKSWYSFIISTLVGSVYAYGFLMLVPSIYINYRLKSVAHMPRKAMVYKFLNTFIDDLFAFVVKMPLLHRLATLRDDVIFFVYLYQTWIYRIDYSRVNEFGQGGDDDEAEIDDAAADKAEVLDSEQVGRAEAQKVNELTGAGAVATGTEARTEVRSRQI